MTEKKDDYRRLTGDGAPLRVLFLDMDGVMISISAQRDRERHLEDRARYGHAVTPDRSARLALDFLLQLTGAKVCLASAWAWHKFLDGTPGLDHAIEQLQLEPDQWFEPRSFYDPAADREAFRETMWRDPEHQHKGFLIHNTLANAALDRQIAGWALVDDDFGGILFDKMKGRGLVKVEQFMGLDIPAALNAARTMRVEISEQVLDQARELQRAWKALRDEDGLWAYETEKI